MIDLYAMPTPNVLKVLLQFEELGLEYRIHRINVYGEEQFTPAFKALNPNSKVPVIIDPDGPDGEPITIFESGAILIYFAEKSGRFMPNDPRQRIATLQWLMVQMGSIGPMFGQSNHFRRSAPPGNDYATRRYVTEVKRLYDVVEDRLGQSEFLGGPDYSIADMAAWPWVALYDQANGVDLASLPAVRRWVEAIRNRPATQRALEDWPEFEAYATNAKAAADPDKIDHLFGRGKFNRA